MSIVLFVCGIKLWRHREETGDRSRAIHGLFCLFSSALALIFIFRTWNGTTVVDSAYLDPEHTFIPILFQMALLLYPLEVLRPKENPIKIYSMVFTPLIILFLVGIGGGIEYTEINTSTEMIELADKPNVLFRLITSVIVLSYGFVLFIIPYDYKRSSANRYFLISYASGYFILGFLHFAIQFTHSHILVLAHQVLWLTFLSAVTWYELTIRLVANDGVDGNAKFSENTKYDHLWENIMSIIEVEHEWRNPNLTLSSLTSQVYSNRTYVSEAFKRNAGTNFSEYISRRRIRYVVEYLNLHPEADIKSLFFYVGYRSYSTAWDNFRRITGMTPAEFISAKRK